MKIMMLCGQNELRTRKHFSRKSFKIISVYSVKISDPMVICARNLYTSLGFKNLQFKNLKLNYLVLNKIFRLFTKPVVFIIYLEL